MVYLLRIFKSGYCLGVFLFSLAVGYFIVPKNTFHGVYAALTLAFLLLFSMLLTCAVRNIKEKILLAKTYKNSFLGIIAAAVGLGAFQVCGLGAPVCGAAVGWGVVSAVLPAAVLNTFGQYAVYLVAASLISQLAALYFMNCFKKVPSWDIPKKPVQTAVKGQ